MVFLEVRVAVRGTDRVGRGAKPKSSASFKDDGSNYLSARSCWLFIAPETFIVALQGAEQRKIEESVLEVL